MSFPVHGSSFPSLGQLLVPPGTEEPRLYKHGHSKCCKTWKLISIEQWLLVPQVGRAPSAAGALDQRASSLGTLRVPYSTQDHEVNYRREGTVFGTREAAHVRTSRQLLGVVQHNDHSWTLSWHKTWTECSHLTSAELVRQTGLRAIEARWVMSHM